MAYRAQLVIRTSEQFAVSIFEEIREKANDGSRTISEVALDYLRRGKDSIDASIYTKIDIEKAVEAAKEEVRAEYEELLAKKEEQFTLLKEDVAADADTKSTKSSKKSAKKEDDAKDEPAPKSSRSASKGEDHSLAIANRQRRASFTVYEKAVEDLIEVYETKGDEAAGEAIAKLYKKATPIDGGHYRQLLRNVIPEAKLQELFELAAKHEDYQNYQERLLFGADAVS